MTPLPTISAVLLVLSQVRASPQPTPTPGSGTEDLISRVAVLERENSDLKTKLIDCMTLAKAKPADVPADDRASQEAITALQALRTAKQGSLMDFRRYYLDAAAKVDSVPSSRSDVTSLREVVAIYSDAHELFTLGAERRATKASEERWLAIRAPYSSVLQSGCRGVIVFGRESSVTQTYTNCGLALCGYAETRLSELVEERLAAASTEASSGNTAARTQVVEKSLTFKRPVDTNVSVPCRGTSPEKAVDGLTTGSMNDVWCVEGQYPYWLAVDLGQPTTVTRWVVYQGGAGAYQDAYYNLRDFTLQSSGDRLKWETVDPVINSSAAITDRMIAPTTARWFRILVTRAGIEGKAAVYEFQLF